MTQNRLIVTIDNDQDLSDYAKSTNAKLIRLESRNKPKELDWFRLDKYQKRYDVLMYIGEAEFDEDPNLFEKHLPGKIYRDKFDVIVLDKTSPRIFKPVYKRLLGQQVRDLVNARIEGQDEALLVGVGTELKKVLSRKYKAPPCELCNITASKMDSRGVRWCQDNFQVLVHEINDNAKKSNNYLVRFLAKAGDSLNKTKPLIEDALTDALKKAKASTFVYPFIYSQFGTRELELSVASIRKFFDGESTIFVFGDNPNIEGVTHVPMERLPNKHEDQVNKLKAAINRDDIPEEFVWMMDDIYFLKPLNMTGV